jgi:hypothetical protein
VLCVDDAIRRSGNNSRGGANAPTVDAPRRASGLLGMICGLCFHWAIDCRPRPAQWKERRFTAPIQQAAPDNVGKRYATTKEKITLKEAKPPRNGGPE